jgi:hypothetical protein
MRGVTVSAGGLRVLRVSTDNGASFLGAAGDYVEVSSAGAETATATNIGFHATSSTAARSGEIEICGFNLTTPKTIQRMNRTDVRTAIIPTASPLNAVRIFEAAGVNQLTAGNIWVYAR